MAGVHPGDVGTRATADFWIEFLPTLLGAAHASVEAATVAAPSPPLLPSARLQNALDVAAAEGVAKFTVPPGEYNFTATSLRLMGLTDMEISGFGVTLWFSPGSGLLLNDCTRVSIRGLILDYTPTVAQGVVLSVDRDSKAPSFTARFDPNFLDPCPAAATSASCKVCFWSSRTQLAVRNVSAPAAINIFTAKVVADPGEKGVFRVFTRVLDPASPHGIGLARVGQAVTVFHGLSPHSYTALNSTAITLEDISIFGGAGMGIVDGQGGGGSTYRRVQLTRRPLTRGVGATALSASIFRFQCTNEDGFHSNGNDHGPIILDSTFAFTGDDTGNICSGMSVVLGSFGMGHCVSEIKRLCGGQPSQCKVCCGQHQHQLRLANCTTGDIDNACGSGGPEENQQQLATTLSLVDVGFNLLRGRAGDVMSFYHLNTQAFQGSVTLADTPTTTNNEDAIAKMRAGYATMQAPPYSAHFVQHTAGVFSKGLPVEVRLSDALPPSIQAYWSIAVLESTDNAGSHIQNSTFSDSYARAFMVKARDAVFTETTFRRAGGIHIGPEQAWLEGDPGINNVTIESNVFQSLGEPAVQINSGVPAGREIVIRNNNVTG